MGECAAYLFVVEDEVGLADELVGVARVLEGDEAEALGAARLAVDHDGAVDDLSVLREEGAHGVGRRRVREAADEVARVAEVLFARDRALGVDLRSAGSTESRGEGKQGRARSSRRERARDT